MWKAYFSTYKYGQFLEKCSKSKELVLVVVFVALFLDNMLLTVVGESFVLLF